MHERQNSDNKKKKAPKAKEKKKAALQQQNENTKYRKKKQINRQFEREHHPDFILFLNQSCKFGLILYIFKARC